MLLVSLDGLDARYLSRADEYGLKIPTLRRLIAGGVTARAGVVGVYPSVTYPSHTTIVTGAWPPRHGIFANEVFDPASPQARNGHWFARDIRAETLWDAAARGGLAVGLISWPVAGGAGDWNMPEIWQPGGTQKESLARIRDHARPAGLAEEIEAHDRELYARVNKDEQDDMRTRFAEYVIERKRPHVMLVHLFDLDHFQHDYGPFTTEAFAILEKSDAYVARMLDAAGRAGTLGETAVFVVSDHGFLPLRRQIHPGVILRRAGLIDVHEEEDEGGRTRAVVKGWRAYPHPTSGSCSVMLRDAKDAVALRRVRAALNDFLKREGAAFRIIEPGEVRRLRGNTRAALMLEAAEGYSFGVNLTGDAIIESTERGQHGYLPTIPGYRASFVASGAGVTRRGDIGAVRMIDIAPTVARALGLTLRHTDGRPLRLR